jgi:hypothetical protein
MLVLYKAARGGGVTVPEGIGVATAVVGSTLIRYHLLLCLNNVYVHLLAMHSACPFITQQ